MLVGSYGWLSGSSLKPSGVARFYILNGPSWKLEQKVNAPAELASDAGFGMHTALTATVAYVCTPYHDVSTGVVYVYTQQQGGWTLRQSISGLAKNSHLGWSIAAHEDTVLIGAFNPSGAGFVHVYRARDDAWSLEQVLQADDLPPMVFFGFSVALHGDMAVVGVNNVGAAYVYRRTGMQWDQAAKLVGPVNTTFGIAVGISATTVMVGAVSDDEAAENAGAAYVYDTDTYSLQQKLLPSDATVKGFFGRNLVIQDDIAVVASAQAYAPSVLTYNGSAWREAQRPSVVDGESAVAFAFGVSVALHDNWLVVGTFESVSVWQQPRTTTTTSTTVTTPTTTSSTSSITFPLVQNHVAVGDTDNAMVIAVVVGAAVLLCVMCGGVVVAVAMRSRRRWERGGRQAAGDNVRRQKLSTRSTSHGRTLTASSRSVSRGTHMRGVSRQASTHSLHHPRDHYGKLPQTLPDDSALYSNVGVMAGSGASAPYSNIGVVTGSGGAEYESGAVIMALAAAKKGGGAYQRGELGVRDSTEYADSDVLLLRRAANEAIYTPGPVVSDEK